MNEAATCSYAELDGSLRAAGAPSNAAEAHGLLCGLLVAGGSAQDSGWRGHLLGAGNTQSASAQACNELLDELHNGVLGELNDTEFGFGLLLPSDEVALPVRTRALGDWCGSFLYGLALGGIREHAGLPATVREVMHDFYEISRAGFSAEPLDEDDEIAYAEITEYVRISVLLLHGELQQPLPASARLQ